MMSETDKYIAPYCQPDQHNSDRQTHIFIWDLNNMQTNMIMT